MSGSSLRDAAAHGETAYLVELLKGGANPCSTDENGLCALHYAAWNGYGECVDYLVVNDLGHTKDDDGYASCVKLRTKAGWSALHIAALGCLRAEEIVERLLMAGVDPSLVDETGLTALEIALDNGNRAVAEVLSQPRPSLEARRAAMARLERAFAVVQYRDRPPRPLESDEDAASIASDEDELLESRPSTARTRFSALVVAKEDDEEEEVMTNAAPSGPRGSGPRSPANS
ncbi:hypothetical protein CTAYLR_001905 [Chrysophaeum taylorii]|uniref:Ankyrin repeat protein n=1 Tax=Chrysophaeum taylorii TaxID=2483200 RepID=A0AAD7U945_9STRA|nr:hypothetical protein CTAYLR_001905 [Chrysophaeum taylorii]